MLKKGFRLAILKLGGDNESKYKHGRDILNSNLTLKVQNYHYSGAKGGD